MNQEPVWRAGLQPILILGVPRRIFFLVMIMSMEIFVLGQFWLFGLVGAFFVFSGTVAKEDPFFFEMLGPLFKQSEVMD